MNYLKTLSPLVCLGFCAPLFAEPIKPYFKTDSFFLSEPVAIRAARKQWDGQYHQNGEKQIGSLQVESGVKRGDWSAGILYRQEYQVHFDSDTADLYYAIENNADLTTDRVYQIALESYAFRGLGARLSKHFKPTKNIDLVIGGSLFSASHMQEGSILGSALANTDDEYEFEFDVDYNYSEDILFERKNDDKPDGIGLSLDLDFNWQPNENFQLNANIRDLAGAIFWRNVTYTKATANSDTVTVDDNGFTKVNPVLSGTEGYYSSYTQRLRPSADLKVDYQLNNSNYIASLKTKHYEDLNLFAVGGSRAVANGKLALHYWPQIQTLEANYQGKRAGLSLGLDKLDLSEARTFWLSVNLLR